MIQGYDLPETLIPAALETFLRYELGALVDGGLITADTWTEYLRCIGDHGAQQTRSGSALTCSPFWRERAQIVSGDALPCGHYLPEEAPDATDSRLHQFFSEQTEVRGR